MLRDYFETGSYLKWISHTELPFDQEIEEIENDKKDSLCFNSVKTIIGLLTILTYPVSDYLHSRIDKL